MFKITFWFCYSIFLGEKMQNHDFRDCDDDFVSFAKFTLS